MPEEERYDLGGVSPTYEHLRELVRQRIAPVDLPRVRLEETTQEDIDSGILRARISIPAEALLGRTARQLRRMGVRVPPDILDDAVLEPDPAGGVRWSQVTIDLILNAPPPGFRQELFDEL